MTKEKLYWELYDLLEFSELEQIIKYILDCYDSNTIKDLVNHIKEERE